jgi:anti-sigma-K factor RskA
LVVNCDEFEELAGAYALGALTNDERIAAEAHLASCDKHPQTRDLLAVSGSLALASPELDPPAELKSRLMDAVRADSAETDVPPSEAPRRGLFDPVRRWFAGARLGYALAAAMTFVVIGLLAWNISLQTRDSGDDAVVVQMTGQASGQVVYAVDDKVAFMRLQGLADLPSDKVYEVWALTDGTATPLGIVVPTDGEAKAAIEFDASLYDQIAVTIEQAPGVNQPTTDPITISQEL